MSNKQFRPFRHYAESIDYNFGVKIIRMIVSDSAAVDEMASKGDVITESEISKLANETLPIQLRAEEISEIVDILNIMRVTATPEESASERFDITAPMQRTEKSIAQLAKDLPKLIEFHEQQESHIAAAAAAVFTNLLASAVSAKDHFRAAAANWGGQQPAPSRIARWHGDLRYIALLLEAAAERAGRVLSFTKPEALAVKFIHRALRRAKVKGNTPDAIAREMAREKRRQKRPIVENVS
jgi:hypothetical protein